LIRHRQARQDAVTKCEAFREARRNKTCVVAAKQAEAGFARRQAAVSNVKCYGSKPQGRRFEMKIE
jgi:hypothetical protein